MNIIKASDALNNVIESSGLDLELNNLIEKESLKGRQYLTIESDDYFAKPMLVKYVKAHQEDIKNLGYNVEFDVGKVGTVDGHGYTDVDKTIVTIRW